MNNMKRQEDKIPSIEEQIEQSLTDLKNGNYETFKNIEEYHKELKSRLNNLEI